MKMFLSGAESKDSFEILTSVKQKYILMSYLYLRKKKHGLKYYVDQAGYDVKFMIDSGAHTFQDATVYDALKRDMHKFNTLEEAVDSYVVNYLEWLEENKEYIDVAVELDIQGCFWVPGSMEDRSCVESTEEKIPLSRINEWREKYFKPFHERTGVDICYVMHGMEGESFEKLFDYGDFVGTSAVHSSGTSYGKLFTIVKNHDAKVHGFAVTGKEIKKFHFTTVDSTSWLSGARYGVTYKFTGSSMLTIGPDFKIRRKAMKGKCLEYGLDYMKFMADDGYVVNQWNALQWKMYSDYVEKRWEKKEMQSGELTVVEDRELVSIDKVDAKELASSYTLLKCENCYIADVCTHRQEGGSCIYGLDVDITSKEDILGIVSKLVEMQYGRVIRGKMIEEYDGGVPDKVLSQEITMLMGMIKQVKEFGSNTEEILIKAKGPGILEKFFSK